MEVSLYLEFLFGSLFYLTKLLNMVMVRNFDVMLGETTILYNCVILCSVISS
jgi:hypothetical protein